MMSWEWVFLWGAIAGAVGGFLAGMFYALDTIRWKLTADIAQRPKRGARTRQATKQ